MGAVLSSDWEKATLPEHEIRRSIINPEMYFVMILLICYINVWYVKHDRKRQKLKFSSLIVLYLF